MNLFREIRSFFIRERVWALLFLLALEIYGCLYFWRGRTAEEPPSHALKVLQIAEAKLKEEIRSVGSVQQFMAENPQLFIAFNIFTLLLLTSVFLGLAIDFFWVSRPYWRTSLQGAHGPPEARSWSVGTIFKTILLFILASLGLSILLSFLKAFFFHGDIRNLLVLIHTTLSDIFCIGVVIYFIRQRGGSWRDLGFRGVRLWKDFWIGLAGYVAILPVFILVFIGLVMGAHFFAYEPPPHPLVEIFLEEEKRAPALIAYSVFLACVAGPFFEEIFFRGFCYPAFKKKWGKNWALVGSASFFGLIHQNLFAFLPIFILGLGLAYLYEKRGTLLPSIILHVVHNSIFIAYFFLAKEVLRGIGS